ncbi:hypothetical protein N496_18790 (plasmid) [Clostridium botulinum A2B3 87]|uniref:hypothetical protein n=1 Tax=Clostridium botulinum TaxID=1491 RepID=UPI0004A59C61|nr:hypothetical protein [Clostridium botulinum]KEI95014.1 hypothetical protein N496_18790 [Clostridium botulinum A2B3 87]
MSLNVKELKEFIEDLPDEMEVVIQSIVSGDEEYCSEILDISSTIDDNSGDKLLVLDPKEVSINNVVEDEEVEEIADYLIEFASDAFEHKDREELIKALKHYGKWI